MIKMKDIYDAFHDAFCAMLQKAFVFRRREIDALWALVSSLVNCTGFSMRAVSRVAGRHISRNTLSAVLKKYAYVQRSLMRALMLEVIPTIKRGTSISVIIDDSLIPKVGTEIFGSFKWFDHTTGCVVRAICLVTLCVLDDGQIVLMLPWVLLKKESVKHRRQKCQQEQEQKTKVAIEMLEEIFALFESLDIDITTVELLADAWYSSKLFVDYVRSKHVLYLISGKKNYGVQVPDYQALAERKKPRKGRQRQHWVVYVRVEDYLGQPTDWPWFTDKATGRKIHYRKVIVTLKTTGRVTVYAFWREGSRHPLYLLSSPVRKLPPSPKNVFYRYADRWWIEVAHKELKQQFGLGKCHARDAWVVHGFVGLVFFAYSVWRQWTATTAQEKGTPYACPTWAEEFQKIHHYHEVAGTPV